jgi:hypothetical protein
MVKYIKTMLKSKENLLIFLDKAGKSGYIFTQFFQAAL